MTTSAAVRRPASARRLVPVGPTGLGARFESYWIKAWVPLAVLSVLMVVRIGEYFSIVRKVRPVALSVVVFGIIMMQKTRPSAWRAALRDPLVRCTAVYVGLIAATIPTSMWKGGSVGLLLSACYGASLVFMATLCAPTRENLDRVLNWVVAMAGLSAVLAMVLGRSVSDVVGGNRLGTIGSYDPNDLAAMVSMMIQLTLGVALRSKGKWRWIALLSLGPNIAVLLRTGSRGGEIGLAVALLVLLLSLPVRRAGTILAVCLLGMPVAWKFGPETFRVRTMSMFNLQDDYTFNQSDGRIQIWSRGVGYFLERPFYGVGAGNYTVREGQYAEANGVHSAWLTAHNTYVQTAVELGIFGFAGFVTTLGMALKTTAKFWRRKLSVPNYLYRPELLAMTVSFATTAIFLSHGYSYLFFFPVAMAALARRVGVAESTLRRAAGAVAAPAGSAGGRSRWKIGPTLAPYPLPGANQSGSAS